MIHSPAKAFLALGLVFVSGIVLGGLGHRYFSLREVEASKPRRPSMEEMRKMYLQEMKDRLNLSSKQLDDLRVVLDQTDAKYKEVREKYRPEMQAIQDEQVTRINSLLSAEQQQEYAKLRKERDERRRKKDRDK
ncbi:MAG: hypothetical protein HXY18_09820 [Bryobacteraceae bacterium]|nr:hypothetical protein [Bryobacteraceae bacterium]